MYPYLSILLLGLSCFCLEQWPGQPWSRLHLDFAGPYMGHMFLVLVDAHSKWLDAHIINGVDARHCADLMMLHTYLVYWGASQWQC